MTDWHDSPPSARLRALAMRPALAAGAGKPVSITEICNALMQIAKDVEATERLKACTCNKGDRND